MQKMGLGPLNLVPEPLYQGLGDLWEFMWHDSFIINPGLDLWGFISLEVFP